MFYVTGIQLFGQEVVGDGSTLARHQVPHVLTERLRA